MFRVRTSRGGCSGNSGPSLSSCLCTGPSFPEQSSSQSLPYTFPHPPPLRMEFPLSVVYINVESKYKYYYLYSCWKEANFSAFSPPYQSAMCKILVFSACYYLGQLWQGAILAHCAFCPCEGIMLCKALVGRASLLVRSLFVGALWL